MRELGTAFADPEVVALYGLRADYPQEVFDRVAARTPGRGHALDLGCGPGKATRPLAALFEHVTAVDPSEAMLAAAQAGAPGNVTWICSTAEAADVPGAADLAFFGESIHWMDNAVLFPKLAQVLRPDHLVAVLTGGDAAHDPPWQAAWEGFLSDWVPKITGQPVQLGKRRDFWAGYQGHLRDVVEEEVLSAPIRQSLAEFVRTQHSRATFSYARLGDHLGAFDRDLTVCLEPFADAQGALTFQTRSCLTFGRLLPGDD